MSSSKIPEEIRAKIRVQAKNRCGYCLSLQKYVLGLLEIEHIIPKELAHHLAHQIGNYAEKVHSAKALADLLLKTGETRQASQYCQQAVAIATDISIPLTQNCQILQ